MHSKVTLAREIAYDAFIAVMEQKRDPDDVTEELIAKADGQVRKLDRSFIKEVLFGGLRWFSKIYWIIQNTSDRDLKKASPEVRSALILGTYQIFYMDRVPDRAAVNESVEYIKKKGQPNAVGFVNGILRSIARRAEYFAKPDKEKNPSDYLALQYAHPKWLVDRWHKRFHFDRVKDILSSNNYPPPFTIRLNFCKIDPEHVQEFRTQLLRDEKIHSERKPLRCSLDLTEAPPLTADSLFGKGYYTVQDASSQLISYLVNPKPGEVIFDACCAPGGKLSHMYELANGEAILYGIEKNPEKIARCQETFQRLGHKDPTWVTSDFLDFRPDIQADKILLDAPCSGLGVIRRHPEGKWHKTSKIIGEMARIQRPLIEHAMTLLKPGGELIYSVCSFEEEETLEHLAWLENSFGDKIEVISPVPRIPDYYKRFVTRENCLLIFSASKEAMDGFGSFIIRKK